MIEVNNVETSSEISCGINFQYAIGLVTGVEGVFTAMRWLFDHLRKNVMPKDLQLLHAIRCYMYVSAR